MILAESTDNPHGVYFWTPGTKGAINSLVPAATGHLLLVLNRKVYKRQDEEFIDDNIFHRSGAVFLCVSRIDRGSRLWPDWESLSLCCSMLRNRRGKRREETDAFEERPSSYTAQEMLWLY
ncbi:uncharacterized protein LOC106172744 [Lingula anatina]|uniref:Uncharacterized protein LOC106172744 n=1 Tax=Lingula anatina TaxID=7574 RepID=A0A1S3JF44_LINAN|nr:uncharacterized protein LOC106172744 [Lingula anatina]|eukprot:XP_013409035.1 uncharacterized protein LOC106172744 [Lingula anatina]